MRRVFSFQFSIFSREVLGISFLIAFVFTSCNSNNNINRTNVENVLLKHKTPQPIKIIERIFLNYNEFPESTDSPENLDSIRNALKELETKEIDTKGLNLLINFWMYYTVTDFSTQQYVESVLLKNRAKSIKAIKTRINNKEEWESKESAPFSDLGYLLEKIIKSPDAKESN